VKQLPGRDISSVEGGIVVIDKPENMSSAKVVARVKSILGAKKVGHTGTLDPFATGVLICCINRATRLARFFLHDNKGYTATLMLGVETDTQDATGNVIATHPVEGVNQERLVDVMQAFEGWTDQVPPAFSALKHRGVPLYKLARKGTHIKKPARRIRISSINILEIDLPRIRFTVHCSAGTYIRTLCSDIGKALGCGGHLMTLRRTLSSGFSVDDALSLTELERCCTTSNPSQCLIGMNDALPGMQMVVAGDRLAEKITHGIGLTKTDLGPQKSAPGNKYIKIVSRTRRLLAIVEKKEHSGYDYCCVFK